MTRSIAGGDVRDRFAYGVYHRFYEHRPARRLAPHTTLAVCLGHNPSGDGPPHRRSIVRTRDGRLRIRTGAAWSRVRG